MIECENISYFVFNWTYCLNEAFEPVRRKRIHIALKYE